MFKRPRTSTRPTIGLVALAAVLVPVGFAQGGIVPSHPAILDSTSSRMPHLMKRKFIEPPEVTTAHTNQPPFSEMVNPGGKEIDLVPGTGVAPGMPARDGLDLPAGIEGFGSASDPGRPVAGPAGIALGPLAVSGEDFGSGLTRPDGSAVSMDPSVVPGPGVLGLLLGAGLAGMGRRRRD